MRDLFHHPDLHGIIGFTRPEAVWRMDFGVGCFCLVRQLPFRCCRTWFQSFALSGRIRWISGWLLIRSPAATSPASSASYPQSRVSGLKWLIHGGRRGATPAVEITHPTCPSSGRESAESASIALLWALLATVFSQAAVFNRRASYSPRFRPVSASIPGGVSHAADGLPLQGYHTIVAPNSFPVRLPTR